MDAVERKSRMLWVWIVIALLLLTAGGYYWYRISLRTVYTNDAQIMGFETVISSDLDPYRLVDLFYDDGDFVEKGALLGRLDRSLLEPQFAQAEAAIIQQAAQVVFQEAFLMKVQDDFERAEKGYHDQIISVQGLDHATRDLEMAKASLDLAKAEMEVAEKRRNYLKEQLVHTEIRAPFTGQIAKRWQWKGNVITKGQAIFSLYDLRNVWVLANLQETDIAPVRMGDVVDISVDAYPGRTFTGKVFAIQGSAASQFSLIPQDNATGNYTKVEQRIPIKISIENEANEKLYLFPGMSAEITIRVK
jgi:membrane fusion protein (multidrug efflux system)